ncbi:hypothetical protein FOL47_008928 [Perkinsus chesapeaki]|uniref:Uncharacterized protein n=1 Tax=Perkinsus chesapeaki TaxID=330153 RepID=A0A7J6N1W5_PERCH|nr:hypothetical protein FOL47_008928 [Perkinsus chesapeaki]
MSTEPARATGTPSRSLKASNVASWTPPTTEPKQEEQLPGEEGSESEDEESNNAIEVQSDDVHSDEHGTTLLSLAAVNASLSKQMSIMKNGCQEARRKLVTRELLKHLFLRLLNKLTNPSCSVNCNVSRQEVAGEIRQLGKIINSFDVTEWMLVLKAMKKEAQTFEVQVDIRATNSDSDADWKFDLIMQLRTPGITNRDTKVAIAEDQVLFLSRLGVRTAKLVAQASQRLVILVAGLLTIRLSDFEKRQLFVNTMYLISSPWTMLCCAKALQTYWNITNFMLLLSVSALLPFAISMRSMLTAIPCPRMAALVSNTALLGVFGILWMMGWFVYKNIWVAYVYVMTIWPWLAVASMVARLYVGRDREMNQFSPLSHLPALALAGVTSHVLTLMSLKDGLTLTDCISLWILDPVLSVLIYPTVVSGPVRREGQYALAKVYVVLVFLTVLYFTGESSDAGNGGFGAKHLMFLGGRALLTLRSAFIKQSFTNASEGAFEPEPAPMDESLWITTSAPRKHRFSKFPGPILYRLDVIFDSGLADTDLHGVGPLGTKDLLLMSDFTYLLPLASIMSWITDHMGRDTLKYGLLPPDTPDQLDTITVEGAAGFIAPSTSDATTGLIVAICVGFAMSYLLSPWSTARSLFDQGSAVHTWSTRPISAYSDYDRPNSSIILQAFVVENVLKTVVHYHEADTTPEHCRYLLKLTQELKFYQPSALREPQKRALMDFLHKMSVEDYQMLLLETSIHHGNNVREILRAAAKAKLAHQVWDPRPSATAAWKLAVSLVVKAMKKQQSNRRVQLEDRMQLLQKIRGIVLSVADAAVDNAEGHGMRLIMAQDHAIYAAKRRAIHSLRRNLLMRKSLRDKVNVARSLSKSAMLQATSHGVLRALSDVGAGRSQSKRFTGSVVILLGKSHYFAKGPSRAHFERSPTVVQPAEEPSDTNVKRGVYCIGLQCIEDGSLPNIHSVILTFGDNKYGQLGLMKDASITSSLGQHHNHHRQKASHVMTVDVLRGKDCIQVVSGGDSNFAMTAQGRVYAWGSNRWGQLGMRADTGDFVSPEMLESGGVRGVRIKESPEMVKLIREIEVVQVSSSPTSSTGQTHTLMLARNGHVYSCGTQTEGALGLGYEAMINQTPTLVWACGDNKRGQLGVKECGQSASLVLVEELSGVRLICCGEGHSLASTYDPANKEERVFAWGANSSGQLGIGSVHDQFKPIEIKDIQMFRRAAGSSKNTINHRQIDMGSTPFFVCSMAAGGEHSVMAIAFGRVVVSFGSNALGQLGVGPNSDGRDATRCNPSVVKALSNIAGRSIVMCAAAAMHSIFLDASGETFVCGDNTYGQLGFLPYREVRDSITRMDPLDGQPAIWSPALLHQIKVYHVLVGSVRHKRVNVSDLKEPMLSPPVRRKSAASTGKFVAEEYDTSPCGGPKGETPVDVSNTINDMSSSVMEENEYAEFKEEYLARKVIVVVDSELVLLDYIDWEARFFIRWLDESRQLAEVSDCAPSKAEIERWGRQQVNTIRSTGGREVVPYTALYFVHLDRAVARGLQPYPQQKDWYGRFEVLDSSLEEPYQQPWAEKPFPGDKFPDNCIFVNGTAYSMGLLKASAFRVGDTHAISIRKSRIPYGGRGVFAEKPFFRHELVSLYWGHMFSEAQRTFMKNEGGGELSTHCIPLMQKLSYLDGMHSCLMKGMHVGQMLNMGGAGSSFNNCEFHTIDVTTNGGPLGRSKGVPTAMKAVVLRATRYIFPGEELYVSYGASFWKKQEMVCLEPPPVQRPLTLEEMLPPDDLVYPVPLPNFNRLYLLQAEHKGETSGSASDSQASRDVAMQYLARKVIVKSEGTGGGKVRWDMRFFVGWIDGDGRSLAEIAECAPTDSELQMTCTSGRQRRDRDVVGSQDMYFVHPDKARLCGLMPHPEQEEWFKAYKLPYCSYADDDRDVSETMLPNYFPQPWKEQPSVDEEEDSRLILNGRRCSLDLLMEKAYALGDSQALTVRWSRIFGGGRGVFAMKSFHKNEVITLYSGHVFSEAQRHWMKDSFGGALSSHCIPLMHKLMYVDGLYSCLMKGMYVGQLINMGGSGSSFNNVEFCPVELSVVEPRSTRSGRRLSSAASSSSSTTASATPTGVKMLAVKATRYIYPGEELYGSYGTAFWNKRDCDCREPPTVVFPSASAVCGHEMIQGLPCLRPFFEELFHVKMCIIAKTNGSDPEDSNHTIDDPIHRLPLDEIKIDTDQLLNPTPESEEFVCKICHTYIVGCQPKITKCSHMFCGDCLEEWSQIQPTFRSWVQVARTAGQARNVPCPVCKTPLNDKKEIFSINPPDPQRPECQSIWKMLSKLKIKCHYNPDFDPTGSCQWTGTYDTYQAHAKTCKACKAGVVIAPNTTQPGFHTQTDKANSDEESEHEGQCQTYRVHTIMIPFEGAKANSQELGGHVISVGVHDQVRIDDKSESGLWVHGVNITRSSSEGWFPAYCLKRLDEYVESEGLVPPGAQPIANADREVQGSAAAEAAAKMPTVLAERASIIRDFDPHSIGIGSDSMEQFLPVSEGEVVVVWQRRARAGWNLCISGDGARLGWVPDNRCKTIREGMGYAVTEGEPDITEAPKASPTSTRPSAAQSGVSGKAQHAPSIASTYIARRAYDSNDRPKELSVMIGDIISIRGGIAHQTVCGWTLGTIVAQGGKKEGWFPQWVLQDQSKMPPTVDKKAQCATCGTTCPAMNTTLYGTNHGSSRQHSRPASKVSKLDEFCSRKCWDKYVEAKMKAA